MKEEKTEKLWDRDELLRSIIYSVFQVKGNKVLPGCTMALDFRPLGQRPPKCQIFFFNLNYIHFLILNYRLHSMKNKIYVIITYICSYLIELIHQCIRNNYFLFSLLQGPFGCTVTSLALQRFLLRPFCTGARFVLRPIFQKIRLNHEHPWVFNSLFAQNFFAEVI